WASQLSHDEAVLAARYVPLALNNFPTWFGNFALAHPRAVDEVLGQELSCELAELATGNSQFKILQLLRRADTSLVALFSPRLVCWFETVFPTQEYGEIFKAKERLRMVVDLLLEHGDVALSENVQQEAAKQLASGLDVPFADVWLHTLFRLSPADGAAVFAQGLAGLANEAAITWFAALFGERSLASPIDLSDARFTPELRLQLLRLAYQYVRPEEDIRHEGAYSPGVRDNAQRARSKLLDSVLDLSGPSAWAIKVEMANDPLFTHFRDRALQLAKEKAAQDIDSRIYSSADMQALYKGLEAVPANTDELFELMGNRLDDLEDFLLQDASPRELWAQIDEEKLMRREIARVLGEKAKGAYTAEQENVTADEKETDIRLNIARSNLVGVIELKLGNKSYSGRDLRDTLRNQLVEKYMAPSIRRAGYLLVTLAKDRNWEHPETGETLDVDGLREMLATEARRIVDEMGYSLRLGVKVLDLRPRLPGKRDV
ncbi:MAG: hypothetical protein LWW81_10285, partial [Rhodocyclales bacterium]|nr:hypothetical protein [Rhodocyclales bacterium]